MSDDDPLEDFEPRTITLDGVAKVVHVAGGGPAVIVMAEMPGISPHVARFAAGCATRASPSTCPRCSAATAPFPTPRRAPRSFQRACVSAEFRAFAANKSSPVTSGCASLARLAHERVRRPRRRRDRDVLHRQLRAHDDARAGDARAGALAAVAAARRSRRPRDRPRGARGRARAPGARGPDRDGLPLRGRQVLQGRSASPPTPRRSASASSARVLPDSAANPEPPPFFEHVVASPHSVVTAHLIDEAGQPTIAARDEILAFFAQRLASAAASAASVAERLAAGNDAGAAG